MKFQKIIKILGIKSLLKEFENNLLEIRKYLIIELGKNSKDDISRYIREIKEVMKIDFNSKSSSFKENIAEVIEQINK